MNAPRPTVHAGRRTLSASRFAFLVPTVAGCAGLAFALLPVPLRAAEVDLSRLLPRATNKVEFLRDIKPILEASCLKCHGPEKPKSKFRIDDRDALLRGGENGKDVFPGDSAKSPLIHYVSGLVEDMEMPPKGKGERLTSAQISLLRAWIDQGVEWGAVEPAPRTVLELDPTLRWVTVSGNEQKFRAQEWFKEGWNGGVENFLLQEQLGLNTRVTVTGHALVDDYKVTLAVEKSDASYVRGGFEQYRKWFNDLGGYYQPFAVPIFSLNEDLHLDIGKAWVEAGTTLADGTQISAGYEYQYRQGQKSLTSWLPVTQSDVTKAILPVAKSIDEQVQTVRLNISHDWERSQVQDNFRVDFYGLNTGRATVPDASRTTNFPQQIQQGTDLQSLANALKFQIQPQNWLLLSAGYLYTHVDGDASFALTPVEATSGRPASGIYLNAPSITLEQNANVINANAQVTPWDALNLSAGVQAEWNRQSAFGTANYDDLDLSGLPVVITNDFASAIEKSDIDRFITEEQAGLRFTQIPYTVVYGDVRFRQEQYCRVEEFDAGNPSLAPPDFQRNIDSQFDTEQYRAGFNVSPWTRVALNAYYLHRNQDNDYMTTPEIQDYPGYITRWHITTDEVGAKLTLRPASWLKTTLAYSVIGTDYDITTQPNIVEPSPGGTLQAGQYDAQVYSINATLNPWRRLYLYATFSFADSKTTTAANGDPAIVPYEGQTYSVLASATYALNEKTDLLLSYNFSKADYAQNNAADGLPLGIDYQRHGLRAGVARQFWKRISARLDYVWFYYNEPTSGDYNNYTGNGVFATMFIRWP